MFGLRYLPHVVTLTLDESRCGGCGLCVSVCPHTVFTLENRKARIADRDACMECGACARNCAPGAISVQAGVGCATAVIMTALRGDKSACGCSLDGPCCG